MTLAITFRHYQDSTVHVEEYIKKKMLKLQRYLARHVNGETRCDVIITRFNTNKKERFECEVIVHTPHEKIVAKESTMNVYAAIDIVEAKVKNQLTARKEKFPDRRVWSKLLRSQREI